MSDGRKKFTPNETLVLFNEVGGRCPICGMSLTERKKGKITKVFEIAHIYPVNPTVSEQQILMNEERLSIDVNDLDNVLAVCNRCHEIFDNPRTKEDYLKWVQLKKSLIADTQSKRLYARFNLEEDLSKIVKQLEDLDLEEPLVELNFKHLQIDEKINNTLSNTYKRTIKRDVVDYFNYLHALFVEMEKQQPHRFSVISAQIKSFYHKLMEINDSQTFVYEQMVAWLDEKTENYSRKACEIIIAYFIQNCEVFS